VAAGAGPAGALEAAHAALEASVKAGAGAASAGVGNANVSADPGNPAPALRLDYLALIDPADFTPAGESHTGPAVLAVAARVGTTRLIDNLPLEFGARS
jgi:pantoate--beta-alanine ligase